MSFSRLPLKRLPSTILSRTYSTPSIPHPPKGTDSSTSASDYKLAHPSTKRVPTLPTIDPPRWSAEQAVNNILYNSESCFSFQRVERKGREKVFFSLLAF